MKFLRLGNIKLFHIKKIYVDQNCVTLTVCDLRFKFDFYDREN